MGPRSVLAWLRSPGSGLRARVVHGGVWAGLLNTSNRLVQLLKLVVLARLLVPDDFGVVGIGLVAMTLALRLTDVGFDEALVQHERRDVDTFLDTTWAVRIVRGIAVAAVLVLFAPFVATAFGDPRLTDVVRAFALVPLLKGLTNPGIIYFRKQLAFHREFGYQFSGTATNVTVAIGAAVLIGNLWAIVFGVLAGEAVQVVASYLLSDRRPALGFDREQAAELFGFGRWIYGSGLVLYIIQNGDDLFVGWLLGAPALGLYRVAYQFGNAPATEVANVVLGVLFPTFARLQNDPARLREAFERSMEVVYVAGLPMTAGIVLVAPAFTRVALGTVWVPMVPVLQVIAMTGMVRAVVETGRSLFRGVGEPAWDFRMNAVRLGVIVVTIWPLAVTFGTAGAAVSITLGMAATLPIWLYKSREVTKLSLDRYLRIAAVPAIGTLVMVPVVYSILAPTPTGLVGGIAAGVLTYGITVFLGYRLTGRRPIMTVQGLLRKELSDVDQS